MAHYQRRLNKEGKLLKHRRRRLDELGFDWEQARWNAGYERLAAFHRKYGHCRLSNPFLAGYSGTCAQRIARRKGNLSGEQIRKLDKLGFKWTVRRQYLRRWDDRLRELAAFKKRFGHCLVPTKFERNAALGNWVRTQRIFKKAAG